MRRIGIAVLVLGGGLVGTACSSRTPGSGDNGLGRLAVAPSSISVPRGRTVPVEVNLERRSNTGGPTTVTASGLPPGISAAPLVMGGNSGTLNLSASASAPLVDGIAVTVVATNGPGSSSASLSLSVTEPGFSVVVTPATIAVGAGSRGAVSVTVIRQDLADPITVTVSGMPDGVTADPLEISTNRGNLILRVASTVPLDSYPLLVSGISGSVSASAPLTLQVVEPTPLDTTFGASNPIPGLVITNLDSSDGGTSGAAAAVGLQQDGNIVAVGFRRRTSLPLCPNQPCFGLAVARYNPNGTLDPTFVGDAGVPDPPPAGAVVVLETSGINQVSATAVAISDAGILIAAAGLDDTLLRLTPEGSLDSDFNADGGRPGRARRTILARAVGLTTDDKILVAGQTVSGPAAFALARYNADGTLDEDFGVSGILSRPFDGATSPSANGAVFTTEDKVKVVGNATVSGRSAVAVMAFDVSGTGSVDESFNSNGQLLIQLGSASSQGKAVLDAQGGSVVVARIVDSANHGDIALAGFRADGGLDPGFGDAGITVTRFDPDAGNAIPNVAAASEDKIAVAGTFTERGTNAVRVLLLRYNLDGSPDSTFGPGGTGMVIGAPNVLGPAVNGVVFQPDGKIVLVGSVPPNPGQFAVIRYAR